MLLLTPEVHRQIVAAALGGYPLEACGLIGGRESEDGTRAFAHYPTANAAKSARVYTVEPHHMLRADRAAEGAGLAIVGVWHSHTHTDAYPSPTDVDQAPDPDWHYVVISLRDREPVVRSYRIRAGAVEEEPVVVQ